ASMACRRRSASSSPPLTLYLSNGRSRSPMKSSVFRRLIPCCHCVCEHGRGCPQNRIGLAERWACPLPRGAMLQAQVLSQTASGAARVNTERGHSPVRWHSSRLLSAPAPVETFLDLQQEKLSR